MVCKYILSINVLVLMFTSIEIKDSVFVSVGKYPDFADTDVNLGECGFNRVPGRVISIEFERKCFEREYTTKTFYIFDELRPNISTRSFNAPDVPYGEAPWVVFLDFRVAGIYQGGCSGVLITFQWVLTSAHCFDNWSSKTSLNVHAGSYQHQGWQIRAVNKDKWFQTPIYWNASNIFPGDHNKIEALRALSDMALVKLESEFSRHSIDGNVYRINPICLPEINNLNTDTQSATFYGYGVINDNTFFGRFADFLKKGNVVLKPTKECYKSAMFCSDFTGNDPRPCSGDSGGPLVQFIDSNRAVLAGIYRGPNADSSGCNEQIKSASWVTVPRFILWILETIRNN